MTLARDLVAIYMRRDAPGRPDLAVAVAGALCVGGPLLLGVLTGRASTGAGVALGAWLVFYCVPKGDLRTRTKTLLAFSLWNLAAALLGTLMAGNLWATASTLVVLVLATRVARVGIIPAFLFVLTGMHPEPGSWQHLLLIVMGTVWGIGLKLAFRLGRDTAGAMPGATPESMPGSAKAAGTNAAREADSVKDRVRSLLGRGPEQRFTWRLALCFTAVYVAAELSGLPHAAWFITGMATTLRPTWGQSTPRIVKRLTGTVIGSALAAVVLLVAHGRPLGVLVPVVALFAAAAWTLRPLNYGFWPVFSAPVMLLLLDFSTTVGWQDAAERSLDNTVGAVIAALATLLLWPGREENQLPDRLGNLMRTHARYLERAATVAESRGPVELLHTRPAAEAAEADLAAARDRLAQQYRPDRRLLAALDDVLAATARLRTHVYTHHPLRAGHPGPDDAPLRPVPLRNCARELRTTASLIDGDEANDPALTREELPAYAATVLAAHERTVRELHERALFDTTDTVVRHTVRALARTS
ncbi:hypothetical protein G6045_39505 [Streptomyces sp. YC504]|uniref:Integral membrane bound transporter domain-containing protein n=1 Tax=Streptomyces mesophilus TaxID=1775132 RepID=A0A6G4XVT8_9ACTN|nr:FUSC family protein [Streptomyces mesophilus]NGO81695.1 hypothetical protein [Streptomyces mesophilus]